ncbi:MAG: DUF1850 domain-containing protein [Halohasta sp.]
MGRRSWLLVGLGSLCIVAIAVLAVVAGGATASQSLVVTDSTDTELLSTTVEEESEIVVEYTHSVEKTPVRDVYVVEDGALVNTRMEFSSFGAGLPAQAAVTVENGRYVYEPPRHRYDPLRVTTGSVADHDLIVDGERYDIAAIADGDTVELRLTRTLI